MKINILYNFLDGPYGGGNQFLKALRNAFIVKEVYEENPLLADIIIVNSKDNLDKAEFLAKKHHKKCIHRIDGIFSLYRGKSEKYNDELVYNFSKQYASGIIYQSQWSKTSHYANGASLHSNEAIIYNAVNQEIFYPKLKPNNKIKLITTSWSSNYRKGFHYLEYLDNNLDFNKFDYTFIGNSPISFKNIKSYPPQPSIELAQNLQLHDIFITGTENDTCSNSLLEALTCKLPVIALDSGGSPELVKKGGELFNSKEDLIPLINKISNNLSQYISNIEVDSIEDVANQYLNFIKNV
jgi:glycosyltransferase involved in cell wall biosynthesis